MFACPAIRQAMPLAFAFCSVAICKAEIQGFGVFFNVTSKRK